MMESTGRYLGIGVGVGVDDALEFSGQSEI